MSHDFAKNSSKKASGKKRPVTRAPQRAPEKKKLPGWVWFITGVAFTLFIQLLWHLAQVDTHTTPAKPAPTANTQPEQKKPAPKKPAIRFYDQLKEQEVKVPEDVVADREQEDYNYVLQAGSFKSEAEANQQRAEIMLLGLNATIEKRVSDSGTTWHRVIVGPFTSRSKLSKAQSVLLNNGFSAMKVKRD